MKGTIQPDWNSKVDLSTQGAADLFDTLSVSGGFSLSDEIPVNISGTPYKITGQTLANVVGSGGAQQTGLTNYVKNCGTISSLPTTLTDTNITSDMVILEATLGTPSVLTSDLTITTANGSVTISGSISGSTTLTIVFGVGYTVAPTILTNLESNTPDNILKADPRPGVTGVLPVVNGGTGSSTAANARTSLDVYSKGETDNAIEQSTAYTVINVGTEATFPTGVSLYGDNKAYICGKLCVLMFSIKMESDAPSSISITNFIQTIDAKPKEDIIVCGDDGLGDGKMQSVIIRNNLSMQIYNVNVGKTTYATGSVAYFVA